MLTAFVEDHNSDHTAPGEQMCQDFDFDAVERVFGELNSHPEQRDKLAQALRFVFDFCLTVDLNRSGALKAIGKRTLALAWVVDPGRFNHDSLRSLARQLGCSAANIAPLTAEFSRLTGIANGYQNHDWRKDEKTDKQ